MMETTAVMNLSSSENRQKQRQLRHADIAKRPAGELIPRMTDEELLDFVHRALHSAGYRHFRNLKVDCVNGVVTLQGALPSYYLKQVAQTVILAIVGVRDIDNDVKVVSSW